MYEPVERPTGWLVGFTAVLTAGMAVATVAQFAFGAMAPSIRADLGISRTQLGGLTTVLFAAGALLSPFVGALTDRIGGRRVLLALFSLNALAFSAMAAAPSYPLLLAAVAISGVAVAGSNPSTNLLIAEHLPSRHRGAVVGVKQSGVQVGSFLAGITFPWLAVEVGWRWALLTVAMVALVSAVLTPILIPTDPVPLGARPARQPLVPAVRWLVPYALFMGAGVAAITAYLALFANEAIGLSAPVAGSLLAVIGGVGVVARVVLSHDAGRRRTTSVPLAWLAAISLTSTVLILLSELAGPWLLWVAAVGVGVSASAWNGVGMLAVIRETGPGNAGRASGLVLTAFYVGLLLMPIGFGALVDATGDYRPAWMITGVCFALALATTMIWTRRGRTTASLAPREETTT